MRHGWVNTIALVIIFGCVMAACNGNGGDAFDFGEDDKAITDLTQAELDSICETLEETQISQINQPRHQKAYCTMTGLDAGGAFDTFDETGCQSAYDNCMAQVDDLVATVVAESNCNMTVESVADCDATLGEYEACLDASKIQNEALISWVTGLTCEATSLTQPPGFFGGIPACEPLSQNCWALDAPWGGLH
ncbi:MAG: hypothetical protein CMH54_09810 [Myxococcales bacterium]|nr:hypothetical protein [Myxococcales bacterium]|tara:strand:+ start:190 stop:765 length:576 start_codon:yes stop_codon:yes gene_type:complete